MDALNIKMSAPTRDASQAGQQPLLKGNQNTTRETRKYIKACFGLIETGDSSKQQSLIPPCGFVILKQGIDKGLKFCIL